MNICLVYTRQCRHVDVMEYFAADDQRAFSCFIHERLMCLVIVCETMFTIGESQAIFYANDTEPLAQQAAANPRQGRFSIETSLKNAD